MTGPAIEQAEMPKATPTPETAPKKDPALVELRAALADKSEPDHVREYAARCIGKVGPDAAPAVPALIEALRDESPLVQRGAALALGDVGPLAKTAVPELKRLADKLKGIDWQAEVTNHISESYYAVRAEAMQCKPIVLADVEANVLFGIHIRDKQGKVIPAGFFELKYRHFTSYCGGMGMDMDKFKTKDTRRQPQYAYDMPSLRHAIRVAKLAAQGFYHGDQTTEASEFRRYRAAECARVRNHREAGFDSDTFLELEPRRAGRLGLQWECLVTEYHPGYDVKSYAFCVQWEALDAVERALASVGEVRE